MTDKQTLQAQITQLKNVLASPKTDGSTRKILQNALNKAEAKMVELEKAQKLESSKKELTPKQKTHIKETKKETKSLAESLKEKVKKAKQKVVTTTPKATTKKGGTRSVAKAKQIAKEMRSKQAKQSTKDADIESDAQRFAINKVRRTSHGGRANQYGTKAENKGGTYYEYRENRYDRQNKRYAKLEGGGMMANGGEVKDFESKVKNAMKEENKWHFFNEEVNGKNVQLKMFVGKKEVDVQIFRINGLGARMPKNYVGKRETTKMIMDNFSDGFADGGALGYANGGSATSSVGGTTFSDGDLSGMFAHGGVVKWQDVNVGDSALVKETNKMGVIFSTYGRKFNLRFVDGSEKTYDASDLEFFKDDEYAHGGMTEHGLMIGDTIISTTNEPYSVVVRNNGKQSIVDLNEGTREEDTNFYAHGGQTRFQSSSGMKYEDKTINVGDFVMVDNPHWKGSTGVDKAVKRKVKMVYGDYPDGEVFFSDGSNSSLKYVKKLEDGGLLGYANGGSATSSVGGTSFSNGDLSGISDIDLSGGMFAKGGVVDIKKIRKQYDENEDNNAHSENVVLLAKHFGTESDLRDARMILSKHEAIGHLPSYLAQERDELSRKLYKKMVEASTKMAKGGVIKVGDMVRSTTFKDIEGEVLTKKGNMLFIKSSKKLPNGDFQHEVLRIDEVEKMAKGGMTSFNDKVKAISKKLLKGKKVSPKVQKDYGKTYNKKEALESAKRIAGAMRKKEMSKKKS